MLLSPVSELTSLISVSSVSSYVLLTLNSNDVKESLGSLVQRSSIYSLSFLNSSAVLRFPIFHFVGANFMRVYSCSEMSMLHKDQRIAKNMNKATQSKICTARYVFANLRALGTSLATDRGLYSHQMIKIIKLKLAAHVTKANTVFRQMAYSLLLSQLCRLKNTHILRMQRQKITMSIKSSTT